MRKNNCAPQWPNANIDACGPPPPPPAPVAQPTDGTLRSRIRSNYCVDVFGASKSPGGQVVMFDCLNQDNQRWQYDDQRRLVSKHSGMCLDVPSGNINDGTGLVQWPCHDGKNQKWQINPDESITPDHAPGKCLDVSNSGSTNQTKLQIYQCNRSTAQKFYRG